MRADNSTQRKAFGAIGAALLPPAAAVLSGADGEVFGLVAGLSGIAACAALAHLSRRFPHD